MDFTDHFSVYNIVDVTTIFLCSHCAGTLFDKFVSLEMPPVGLAGNSPFISPFLLGLMDVFVSSVIFTSILISITTEGIWKSSNVVSLT